MLSPAEAFFADQVVVPADRAIGRIAAESLTIYPPGIPVILPGERINAENLAYIRETLAAGGHLQDPSSSLGTVRVTCAEPHSGTRRPSSYFGPCR